MFTGIVEKMGVVVSRKGRELAVKAGLGRVPRGASVAVNGTCLTVVGRPGPVLTFDVSPETDRLTNLRALRAGDPVNLERPLRLGAEIGGHMVSGHVDGTARLLEKESLTRGFARLRVALPKPLAAFTALKGSVTVDGVSLTVSRVGRGWFECQLIPETLQRTTLGVRKPGDLLNLEADLIARHVARALEAVRR
jgi:riboflavin synthase